MGCCFSREDDRFDGSESLLPKGKLAYVSPHYVYVPFISMLLRVVVMYFWTSSSH